MRTVSAREANQAFSKLLADAASGEEIVITRHGKPVAKLVPLLDATEDKEREIAIERMVEGMRRGLPLGNVKWRREELYER